jgi:hypothetical protein
MWHKLVTCIVCIQTEREAPLHCGNVPQIATVGAVVCGLKLHSFFCAFLCLYYLINIQCLATKCLPLTFVRLWTRGQLSLPYHISIFQVTNQTNKLTQCKGQVQMYTSRAPWSSALKLWWHVGFSPCLWLHVEPLFPPIPLGLPSILSSLVCMYCHLATQQAMVCDPPKIRGPCGS